MNFAIIDATAARGSELNGGRGSSRYATSVANLPLIVHVFDELASGGIKRARIVASPPIQADLGSILDDNRSRGIDVSYLDAPAAEGRRTVLTELDEALSHEAVLLHPGDSLFGSQISAMGERFRAGDVDLVLPEQASVAPLRSPTARRVSETVVALGPGTRPVVAELLLPASDGDDLVASLLTSDCRLGVCAQTEHWHYSESTDALLAANRMMLDALILPPAAASFGEGNQMHGRISVNASAYVSNCVIHGPVSIADRVVLEDSFIGPYTAIGPDVIISGAEVDNTMLLAGAEVRHPGYRIEASIIGERSRISRSFGLPKGLHARLGPDSTVTLS